MTELSDRRRDIPETQTDARFFVRGGLELLTRYEQYFGLARPLFGDALAEGDALFATAHSERLGRDLAIALQRRDSVAVLAGASGTGKTTIAIDSLRRLSSRLAFAGIDQPPSSPDELLEQLLCDFDLDLSPPGRVARRQLWKLYLTEMAATDTQVCLLVENADELHPAILKFLHQLTAADANLVPGCNIILTTTGPADALLERPELGALRQRVRLRAGTRPLTASEVGAYTDFKCRLGEVARDRLFADDSTPVLARYSGGIIRVLDGILETALSAAASRDSGPLTADFVEQTAQHLIGLAPMTPGAVDDLLATTTPSLAAEANPSAITGDCAITKPGAPARDIPTLTDPIQSRFSRQTSSQGS